MTTLATIDVVDLFLSALCEDSEATQQLVSAGSTDATALIFWYILASSCADDQDPASIMFSIDNKSISFPTISGGGLEWDILQSLRMDIAEKRASSMSALGYMHLLGIIVPCNSTEAIQLFMHSVLLGCTFGKLCLAHCLLHGTGIQRSEVSAVILYESLVPKGCAWAQNCLGFCLFHGLGLPVATLDALRLFQKAAAKGLRVAQQNAQFCLDQGIELSSTYHPYRFTQRVSQVQVQVSDTANDSIALGLFDGDY